MLRRLFVTAGVALMIFTPLFAQQNSSSQQDYIVLLDQNGTRGLVFFDHKAHQNAVNPDPEYKFKTDKTAPCAGCHHTKSATGVIQLWSCRSCHGYEAPAAGTSVRSKVYADDAFHGNCISCHRAAKKGPVLCSGCHKLIAGQ